MSLEERQIEFGDFQSEPYKTAVQAYLDMLPNEQDLPSEGILDTTILFLRSLFYQLPKEHEYRWEGQPIGAEDENETGITITDSYPVKKEVVDRRPAIIVKLQPRQFMGLHQDQLKHYYLPEDIYTSADLVSGSVAIYVVSRTAHLCRRLSDWIGLSLRVLVRQLTFAGFHSIHPKILWSGVDQAGDMVRPSDTEHMMATVGFNYTWTWTMRNTPIAPTRFAAARMNIIAYGRPGPALDGSGSHGGIVDPEDLDSFTQSLLEEERED